MTLPVVTITLPVITLTNSEQGDDPYLVDHGLYDSTEPKLDNDLEWPNADGASDQDPVYDAARYFDVVGRLITVDDTAVFDLRTQIMALKTYRGQFPVSLTDPNGTFHTDAQLAGKIEYLIDRVDGVVTFTIPLMSSDPLLYGEPKVLATGLPTAGGGLTFNLFSPAGTLDFGANGNLGRVILTNDGDATVWPTVLVTGGLTLGFYVQKITTGEVVRYDRLVPEGGTVSIDFRTGEVLIDGVSDGSTYLTRFEYFSVAPGESFEVQFNEIAGHTGTPTMALTYADGNH